MGLAIGWTDSRTGAASDASTSIIEHHNFAFDFVVIFVEIDLLALIVNSLQSHDPPAADFEATATSNADIAVNLQQVLWLPSSAVSSFHFSLQMGLK